ncbi:MAG TPA: DUF1223 domain-containing protein [Caulobacteraceae bacterium]|nr:DUF1223 domain-containing protein [Caulobacteraceae bacterium]
MTRRVLFVGLLALAAAGGAARAAPPVVLELFTAQGCASCGEANAHVAKLADEKGVIALTWSVDYWDYLGWKDTFAKPEFADRQRDYAAKLGVAEVYTPQVVVDGREQTPGVKDEEVDRLVREARHVAFDPPQMRFLGDRIAVGSGRRPRDGAEIWLVRYDPREQDIEVKDGDNRGHTVVERNVVVQLARLGAWRGRPVLLPLPPPTEPGLDTVVIVQGAHGGKIIGVAEAP